MRQCAKRRKAPMTSVGQWTRRSQANKGLEYQSLGSADYPKRFPWMSLCICTSCPKTQIHWNTSSIPFPAKCNCFPVQCSGSLRIPFWITTSAKEVIWLWTYLRLSAVEVIAWPSWSPKSLARCCFWTGAALKVPSTPCWKVRPSEMSRWMKISLVFWLLPISKVIASGS